MRLLIVFGVGLALGYALETNKEKTIDEIAARVWDASLKLRRRAEKRFSK